MFPLIETIKIVDGEIQNLSYHQHRFEASYFKLYGKLTEVILKETIKIPEEYQNGIVKLRFLYNQTDCFCQFETYRPKPVKTLRVIFDNSIDYSLKWVNRKDIQNLMAYKNTADDILIVKNDMITDTSFTNIAFWDGLAWVTPRTPLLHGTARARLLDKKILQPADIFIGDLPVFKSFKIFNAMLDFEKQQTFPVQNIFV